MKKKFKFSIVLLIIVLCTSFLFACGETPDEVIPTEDLTVELPKRTDGTKAIIFVPGILGGQIYNCETGEFLWDPFESEIGGSIGNFDEMLGSIISDSVVEVISLFSEIILQKEDNVLAQLMADEDGNMLYDTTVAYPFFENRRKYGALNSYQPAIDWLQQKYGEEYEVKLFNYNWLEDIRKSAGHLEEFINANNYTQVVLISHSMGGLVSAQYLANRENRARIDGYISICAPYYGSNMAMGVVENPNAYRGFINKFAGVFKNINIKLNGKTIQQNFDELYDNYIMPLLVNTASVAQLLPSAEMCALDNNTMVVDGKQITTAEDLLSFYSGRPWAIKKNGEVRSFVADFNEYHESFYVDKNGTKIFSTELVDSYYIGGTGQLTENSTRITAEQDNEYITTTMGDQTVLTLSATLGKAEDNERVFYVEGKHNMGNVFDGECQQIAERVIDKLKSE